MALFNVGVRLARRMTSSVRRFSSPSDSREAIGPAKTPLFDFHVSQGGKMVEFAGYLLPVQYANLSLAQSHLHTRARASLFDVSHMLQTFVRGRDSVECFESICTADIAALPENSGSLTVFTNEKGHILDDLIVTKVNPGLLYVVSNAAMKNQDIDLMQSAVNNFKSKGKDVDVEFLEPSERALLALQGPESVKALQKLTKIDLSKLFFMATSTAEVAGVKDCRITRCGYTGENGFELSVPAEEAPEIAQALLNSKESSVKLAGLGARDSLRLEAGLCLYGSDIDSSTTPIEAGLAWLVAKRRRTEENFPGANRINEQLRGGVQRRRVGLLSTAGGPPARSGVSVFLNGSEVGRVTSGCPSPSLGKNIAMGYLAEEHKKIGTPVELRIRNKLYPAIVSKMPFVPSNYFVRPKN